MDESEFKRRTQDLAVRVIDLVSGLGPGRSNDIMARQLIRSITSVGANYRASCRGRSIEEIVAKLAIVEEEADESMYWLELLIRTGGLSATAAQPLLREAGEILAMTISSKKTLKTRAGIRGFGATAAAPRPTRDESRIANRES